MFGRRIRPGHIRRIFSPPPELQGRVGAARVVLGRYDYTMLVLYYPPRPRGAPTASCIASVDAFTRWARDALDQARGRSTPIIQVDLNGLLGAQNLEGEWIIGESSAVGTADPDHETYAGESLRQLLEDPMN